MMSVDEMKEELGEDLAAVLEHHYRMRNVEEMDSRDLLEDLEQRLEWLLSGLLPEGHPKYPGSPKERPLYAGMNREPWPWYGFDARHPQPAGPRWREMED